MKKCFGAAHKTEDIRVKREEVVANFPNGKEKSNKYSDCKLGKPHHIHNDSQRRFSQSRRLRKACHIAIIKWWLFFKGESPLFWLVTQTKLHMYQHKQACLNPTALRRRRNCEIPESWQHFLIQTERGNCECRGLVRKLLTLRTKWTLFAVTPDENHVLSFLHCKIESSWNYRTKWPQHLFSQWYM